VASKTERTLHRHEMNLGVQNNREEEELDKMMPKYWEK
jgi:hypothetical protein